MARSDAAGLLATPVETIPGGPKTLGRIVELVEEFSAREVVVGLPISLSGKLGPAARQVQDFAVRLAAALAAQPQPVSVRLVDERLTTVSAERVLREVGRKGARQRAVVDQAAAVEILQHALDAERSSGRPPGQEVRQVP